MRNSTLIICLMLMCLLPVAFGQIKINEVSVGTPDFVELVNCSPGPIDVSGWVLRQGRDNGSGSGFLEFASFTFPSGTMIAGGGYLVLEEGPVASYPCSMTSGFNFPWGSMMSVAVLLEDDAGEGCDYVFKDTQNIGSTPLKPPELQWFGSLTQAGNVIARIQGHDTNSARDWREDLPSSLATPCAPNPGQHGDWTPFRKVMITEANSGNPDWVELTNFTRQTVDLSGWSVQWHDPMTHSGAFPPGTIIVPGESIVVLPIGSSSCPGAAFGAREFSIMSPPIGTTTEAFSVCLLTADGINVDEVRVSSTGGAAPTVTCDGSWRGLVDRTGTLSTESVERIWGLDSDSGRDWTVGEMPSCGRESTSCGARGLDPLAPTPEVVINEIDDHPGLIEIANNGAAPVDLANWFFLCSGIQGQPHVKIAPFKNRTLIPAFGYLVVGNPVGGVVDIAVQGSDHFGQFIAFGMFELSCALYDRRGRVVDVVRTTNEGCDMVHNYPRAPCHHSDWYGAARRCIESTAVVARRGGINPSVAIDTNRGDDWGIGEPPTFGGYNVPVICSGHPDALDVRLSHSGLGAGLTMILNAGPAKSGFTYHLFVSFVPTFGCGGFLGLGPDVLLNYPVLSGLLDACGSSRLDVPPGMIPPPFAFESVWVLTDPLGFYDSRTVVLRYDNTIPPTSL